MACPQLNPNSIEVVDANGNIIRNVKTGDTVNVCSYFPYQGWWNLSIHDPYSLLVYTQNITNQPTGNTTQLTFNTQGTFNIVGSLCYGAWDGTFCGFPQDIVNSNVITLIVSDNPPPPPTPTPAPTPVPTPPPTPPPIPAGTGILKIMKNGVEKYEINVNDIAKAVVSFPDYAGYEWKIFDSTIGKLTDTLLYLDSSGNGSIDIQFTENRVYDLVAVVCGEWSGDTCLSIISRSAQTPPVKLFVGINTGQYYNRTKEYPDNSTYSGNAIREYQTWDIPVLNIDEGYNAIVSIIESAASSLGRTLLDIKTTITEGTMFNEYKVIVEYEKPADTVLSMQVQLVLIGEWLAANPTVIELILGPIAFYLVVTKAEEFFKTISTTTPGTKLLIAYAIGAGLLFFLASKDKTVRSLY